MLVKFYTYILGLAEQYMCYVLNPKPLASKLPVRVAMVLKPGFETRNNVEETLTQLTIEATSGSGRNLAHTKDREIYILQYLIMDEVSLAPLEETNMVKRNASLIKRLVSVTRNRCTAENF